MEGRPFATFWYAWIASFVCSIEPEMPLLVSGVKIDFLAAFEICTVSSGGCFLAWRSPLSGLALCSILRSLSPYILWIYCKENSHATSVSSHNLVVCLSELFT